MGTRRFIARKRSLESDWLSNDTRSPMLKQPRPFTDAIDQGLVSRQTELSPAGAHGHNFGQIPVDATERLQRSPTTPDSTPNADLTVRIDGYNAPLLDPDKGFAVKSAKTEFIPALTPVTILETQTTETLHGKKGSKRLRKVAQTVVKVQWQGQTGWIERDRIATSDLTYATRLGDGQQALSEGVKTAELRYGKDSQAKGAAISSKETRGLQAVLGSVKALNAYKLSEPKGPESTDMVPSGTLLILVEQQTLDHKTYTKAVDFDGNEFWLPAKAIQTIADPREYETSPQGGRGLFKANKLDKIKNPKARAILETVFGNRVKALLQNKQFTPNQKALIDRALKFAKDTHLHSQLPNLHLSDAVVREEEMQLNPDLINRMNLFYKFLVQEQLIDGYSPSISGVRSSIVAHINSTKWTFSRKSGKLSSDQAKIAIARELVDINGQDPSGKITWASSDQVKRLKEALAIRDGKKPLAAKDDQSKSDVKLGEQTLRQQAEQEIKTIIVDLMAVHGTKTHVCAEGYPNGDAKRKPNINTIGISLHCGGEAIDLTFRFKFNYFDPIIDALAITFGLFRSVKDDATPEYWHYERLGVPFAERESGAEPQYEEMKQAR